MNGNKPFLLIGTKQNFSSQQKIPAVVLHCSGRSVKNCYRIKRKTNIAVLNYGREKVSGTSGSNETVDANLVHPTANGGRKLN